MTRSSCTAVEAGRHRIGDGAHELAHYLIAIAGAAVFTFVVPFVGPDAMASTDFVHLHAFFKHYYAQALYDLDLPLWNPYVGLGRPFQADIQTAVFYPPNVLYAIFGVSWGLIAATFFHFSLAATGMLRLARFFGAAPIWGVLAGIAFIGSGSIAGPVLAGDLGPGHGICYMPWIIYCGLALCRRPSIVGGVMLSIVVALQVLSGHPQAAWVADMSLAVLVLVHRLGSPWRLNLMLLLRDVLVLGLAVVGAVGLTAIQLLPTVELIGQSNRAAASLEFSAAYSAVWADLLVMWIPSGMRFPGNGIQSVYIGVLVFGASLGAWTLIGSRRVRALLVLFVLGWLMALGTNTPVFAVLYDVLPGLSMFRLPLRGFLMIDFALPLLAALSLTFAVRRHPQAFIVLVFGGLAVALIVGLMIVHRNGWTPGSTFLGHAVLGAGVLAALGVWFAMYRSGRFRAAHALAFVLLLIAAADLAIADAVLRRWFVRDEPTVWDEPDGPYEAERRLPAQLRDRGRLDADLHPPRVAAPLQVIRPNSSLLHGYATVYAYCGLMLERPWYYIHHAVGVTPDPMRVTYPDVRVYRALPLPYRDTNTVYGFAIRRSGVQGVANPSPDPRAWLATAIEPVDDREAAILRMRFDHDVHARPLIEQDILDDQLRALIPAGMASPPVTPVTIESFAPERIIVRVETSEPGLLVLSEAWYPGWRAKVAGEDIACIPVNIWQRAVAVPAGEHTVEVYYRSNHLRLGAIISAATLAVMALLLAACSMRRWRIGRRTG